MRTKIAVLAMAPLVVMLTSCGSAQESGDSQRAAEAPAQSASIPDGSSKTPLVVSVPQIAYVYNVGYALPKTELSKAVDAHVALCDALGPSRCRLLAMTKAASDNDAATATLKLEVQSSLARLFSARLAKAIGDAHGHQAEASIEAEDLSKKIVDTEARLRSRELLARRLTELLETRKGTVAELVEAERGVAQVQEEIDEAKSWLAEMRGRVAFSTFQLSYAGEESSSLSFVQSLRESLAAMGSLVGFSIAAIIRLIALILPWALLAAFGAFLWRRFSWRLRQLFRKETGSGNTDG